MPADRKLKSRAEKAAPGLFGCLELARGVYHPFFMDTVLQVLKCVSYYRSKILISPDSKDYKVRARHACCNRAQWMLRGCHTSSR